MNLLKPYLGRVIFTALGLAAAISFMTLGFGRTLLILACCGAGYAIGAYKDKILKIPERLLSWRDKW